MIEAARMPRYYFDVRDDSRVITDDEGVELADEEAATHAAAQALGEMARDVPRGTVQRDLSIEVRNQKGVLLVARLMLAIARKP